MVTCIFISLGYPLLNFLSQIETISYLIISLIFLNTINLLEFNIVLLLWIPSFIYRNKKKWDNNAPSEHSMNIDISQKYAFNLQAYYNENIGRGSGFFGGKNQWKYQDKA